MSDSSPEWKALFVMGMHRSGTSAITGTLSILGVQLSEKLFAPQAGVNEKGFYEHEGLVDLHNELMCAIGSYWDDILPLKSGWQEFPATKKIIARIIQLVKKDFSGQLLWGLKDPRASRLLPLWHEVFRQLRITPSFVHIIRDPEEVYRSLQKRNGFSREKAYLLWLIHNLESELCTRSHRRLFLRFDSLLDNPSPLLHKIEKTLDIKFPHSIESKEKQLNVFLTKALRHHQSNDRIPESTIEKLAYQFFDIASAKASTPCLADIGKFDAIRSELNNFYTGFPEMLMEQLREVQDSRGNMENLFYQAYRSNWWKASAPLRLLEKKLRKQS